MDNRQLLMVGISSLLSGGIASVTLPGGNAIAPIAASTAGALGGTMFAKKREREIHEKTLELYNSTSHSLTELNHSVMANYADFITFKTQAEREQNQLKSEFNSLKFRLYRLENTPNSSYRPLLKSPPQPVVLAATEQISAESPTQIVSQPPANANLTITNWLKERGAEIKKSHVPQAEDEVINRISLLLGNQYATLQTMYRSLKYSVKNGQNRIRFAFKKNASDREIEIGKLFFRLLYENDFIQQYNPSPKSVYASLDLESDRLKFLEGLWLERFVFQEISNLLRNNGVEHQGLMNVEGSFSNHTHYELDALFLVKGRPILVECKSYVNEGELVKFSRKINKLKVEPQDAFFIVPDFSSHANSSNYKPDFNIVDLAKFRHAIAQRFGLVYPLVAQSTPPSVERHSPDLFDILTSKTLRPLKELRTTVLQEVSRLLLSQSGAIVVNQLRDALHYKLGIPKSQIQHILNAIVQSGFFVNEAGEAVYLFVDPVFPSQCLETSFLEQKCLESYAFAVLCANYNYFESSENIADFERVTGGRVPPSETIAILIKRAIAKAERQQQPG